MGGELILAIEDDADVSRLLTVLLEDAGYDVILAEAGDEGLAMARERRPALVLADIGLPNLHGNEVLAAIKADPALSETPVIIVSAWGDTIGARSRELGAYDVLTKPFNDATLLGTVERALAERREAAPHVPPPSSGPPGSN